MSESYAEVREDGAVRLAGTLAYPQATPTDVLTVQADGSIAAASGGSSSSPKIGVSIGVSSIVAGPEASIGAPDQGSSWSLTLTLPTSPFDNSGNVSLYLQNNSGFDVFVSEAVLTMLSQDASDFLARYLTTPTLLVDGDAWSPADLDGDGGSGGTGLSWDDTNKQIVNAGAGGYSAFAVVRVTPA